MAGESKFTALETEVRIPYIPRERVDVVHELFQVPFWKVLQEGWAIGHLLPFIER